MKPFTVVSAIAAPLDLANVDTDRIIPARFLRKPRTAEGLGAFLFRDIRYNADDTPKQDFVLNQEPFDQARILVTDENFGCGSSRESAVWTLADAHGALGDGFRAVIAPSFGDIFYNNCSKNGVLPVQLSHEACANIRRTLRDSPGATIEIDLPNQKVRGPTGDSEIYSFEIDPYRKMCLVEGLDEVALTMRESDKISAYEKRLEQQPWRHPSEAPGA